MTGTLSVSMKLTFLGSAAAEGYPALWCRCERCSVARQRGGRNLRFRAAALINDDLLIDAGPDIVAAAIRLGLDLAPVQAALITHPHTDHLDASIFHWRRRGFCATSLPVLRVYASEASLTGIARVEARSGRFEQWRLEGYPVQLFQRFEIHTGGPQPPDPARGVEHELPETALRRYEVLALQANHAEPEQEAMFYAVRQVEGPEVSAGSDSTGRAPGEPPGLLYATDTGPFLEETWAALEALAAAGTRLHAAVIDSTSGLAREGTRHMNLNQMIAHQQGLAQRGLLAGGAWRVAHHFSHNGAPPHEELEAALRPEGIIPSYDGLTLTL